MTVMHLEAIVRVFNPHPAEPIAWANVVARAKSAFFLVNYVAPARRRAVPRLLRPAEHPLRAEPRRRGEEGGERPARGGRPRPVRGRHVGGLGGIPAARAAHSSREERAMADTTLPSEVVFRIRRFDAATDAVAALGGLPLPVPAGHDRPRGAEVHQGNAVADARVAVVVPDGRLRVLRHVHQRPPAARVQHAGVGARARPSSPWRRCRTSTSIRDLVPDLVPMFDAHAAAKPYIIRDDARRAAAADRRVLAVGPPARGVPAVLLLHQVRLLHGRVPDLRDRPGLLGADAARAGAPLQCRQPRRRLRRAAGRCLAGERGPWRCHFAGECSRVCPKGVDPAQGHPVDEARDWS